MHACITTRYLYCSAGTKLFSDPVINSSSTFVGGLNTAAAGFQYGMVLTIAIQSSGAFTSQVTALTSLDYTYSLYYYDSSSTLQYGRNGFETIEGYPLQGKFLKIFDVSFFIKWQE